jgi:ATP-dependent Clp protease ATP-binding subunit ClpC
VLLGKRGYDPTLGARPLRRAIQRLVEDAISERLLWKEYRAGETIVVDAETDAETGEENITFRSIEGYQPPSMEMVEAGPSPD